MNNDIDDLPTAMKLAGEITRQHGMIRAASPAAKTGSTDSQSAESKKLLLILAMHEARSS